ncbi:MAG: efflux RND transporter periplasmic adaptor subunit [Phyllobacterium sp.]
MIKRFILALIFIAIIGGGLVGFNLFRSKAISEFFATMQQPAVTVSTIKVEPTEWTPEIEAIGTVRASMGVDLAVQTSGVVKDINFKANQDVKQGDLLVQLDDYVERADMAASQAQLVLNEQNLARARTLEQRRISSLSDVESADAAASASRAQVEKLKAVLEQKSLEAPFSGTIGIPRIDIGQYLSPGDVVATLQNLEKMRADFSIPEQFLSKVGIGQKIRLGLTGSELDYAGTIIGIDPKIDPTTRLISIRAEVENPEAKLQPGQFVQVRIILPDEQDILSVPQTSVVTSLYGDYAFVVRPEDKKDTSATPENGATMPAAAQEDAEKPDEKLIVRQVFVKLGRRSGPNVEILDGLKVGDVVVTAGQNRLNSGATVTIDNTVNPATALQTQ